MSITGSMYTGVTGLLTFSASMSVVGNNLANVNTVGFKASRAEFADLMSALEGGQQIGRGVRAQAVTTLFEQGTFQTTGGVSDLAIQGKGLFIVKDVDGKSFYTRAGQFSRDKSGFLVNPGGLYVQGFPLDKLTGKATGGLATVDLGTGLPLQPKASTKITLSVNLDSRNTTPATAFPAGPDSTPTNWFTASNFSTTLTTYDSLGQAHDLTFLFRKNATAGQWDYRVLAKRSELDATAPTSTDLRQVGTGVVAFDTLGALNVGGSTINAVGPMAWTNGAASQTIAAAQLAFTGSTQYATPSSLSSFQQDGSAAGTLIGFTIDTQGVVTGQYSNGGTQPLYKIALADFPGLDRLFPAGNNLLVQSPQSGDPIIGSPGSGGFGTTLVGGVEQSTVDIAKEFVNMIGAQRGFQANSRLITVAEQMYEEMVNLKR